MSTPEKGMTFIIPKRDILRAPCSLRFMSGKGTFGARPLVVLAFTLLIPPKTQSRDSVNENRNSVNKADMEN
jgi:hypothetical protein